LAKKAGCRISLGTDAHDPLQLRFMGYALASAVKAGVPKERILNFMTADQLCSWAAEVRDRCSMAASGPLRGFRGTFRLGNRISKRCRNGTHAAYKFPVLLETVSLRAANLLGKLSGG
jgi:hypothetical protein